MIDAAFSL